VTPARYEESQMANSDVRQSATLLVSLWREDDDHLRGRVHVTVGDARRTTWSVSTVREVCAIVEQAAAGLGETRNHRPAEFNGRA
jgi:secreted PhoX family phosphatase